jgi:hypothetical protein
MVEAVATGVQLPKNIIVTEDGKTYEKAGFGRNLGAVLVADIAGGAALTTMQRASQKPFVLAVEKLGMPGMQAESDVFKKAAEEALTKSGLASKGVKIIDATAENKAAIEEIVSKGLSKWEQKIKPLKEIFANFYVDQAISGKNAFSFLKSNIIVINKDKMSIAAFHEMGHALNKNMGGIGKVLQKVKGPFSAIASVALLTALFKRKKVEGEKPKGLFDKTTTFIKKHCGALAFLAFVPLVAEEALASIKAHKMAKGVLSPENLKTMNKFNGKGLLSYAGFAVSIYLAAVVMSKVKDAMTKPKEVKI